MKKSLWSEYCHSTMDKKPNQTLFIAVKKMNDHSGGTDIDIGSGTGRDSLYLLEHGFKVIVPGSGTTPWIS